MVSKRAVAAGLVVALLIPIALVAVGVLGSPSLADMQNSFGAVDENETEIETDLVVNNPNPLGINLERLTVYHDVAMNGNPMAHGRLDGVVVSPGNSTIAVQSWLNNSEIPEWWVSHVERDERTAVDIDARVVSDRIDRNLSYTHSTTVETDILAGFRSDEVREVGADQPLAPEPMLYINETDAQWGAVNGMETEIDNQFRVYNPNPEPYVITRLGYEITMNNLTVGTGETEQEYVIPGGSRQDLEMTTAIDARTLDDWWVTHLDRDVHGHQVSALRMEFAAVVELPGGQPAEVPLDALTYEDWVGTDIFDEGGDVGVPPAEAPGDDRENTSGDDDGGSTTDGDGDGNQTGDEDDGLLDDDDDGILARPFGVVTL